MSEGYFVILVAIKYSIHKEIWVSSRGEVCKWKNCLRIFSEMIFSSRKKQSYKSTKVPLQLFVSIDISFLILIIIIIICGI